MSETGIELTEDQKRRRRARSLALAGILVGLVILFYIITIVKMGPAILDRPL